MSGRRRRARKLIRGGVALGLVAAGACNDGDAPEGASAPDSADAADATGSRSDAGSNVFGNGEPAGPRLDAGSLAGPDLSSDRLTRERYARNVLYSWTTDKQIAELRADPVLLTRSEGSNGQRPNLASVIARHAADGDEVAKVLAGAAFQKGRYAWPSAWPTVRGWPDESYGNRLLRIELDLDAWIVTLQFDRFTAFDMANGAVDEAQVLAHPERIGAVLFVSEGDASGTQSPQCGTFSSGCANGTYREFFVNNESMVARWSLGTEQILAEIDRGIDVAEALRAQVASGQLAASDDCDLSRLAFCSWSGIGSGLGTPLERYVEALALTSEFYLPTTDNMDALIAALRDSRFTPDPLVHER